MLSVFRAMKASNFTKLTLGVVKDLPNDQFELLDLFECPQCHSVTLDVEGHIDWHTKINKRIVEASL